MFLLKNISSVKKIIGFRYGLPNLRPGLLTFRIKFLWEFMVVLLAYLQ
jgi:hypothetical protein